MKTKSLLLIALGGLALASCTDDEPVSVRTENDAISFRSGISSRATETNNANLSSIYVTAFDGATPYFENVNFVKGSDSFFHSSTRYDWLENDQTIDFYSYSPSQDELGADITTTEGKAGLVLENFAVPDKISDQIDFITANANGNKKENATSGV